MNKDQVKGRADQVVGKVKDAAGSLVGNDKLEAEGELQHLKGKVQANIGDAVENVKDHAKQTSDKVDAAVVKALHSKA
jgi:uncharacterized protein YjbJ (UPF0337 family)